jgi:sRNA-binding protein
VPGKLIAKLATRFPAAFVADRRQPHKPLKIGIDADLIAAGHLTRREVKSALRCYTSRRMYHVAVAAGGSRFDLDGAPAVRRRHRRPHGPVCSSPAWQPRQQQPPRDARLRRHPARPHVM